MSERLLPPPDRYASCPRDGRILEYYEEQFECVYVLLHPFFYPTSISKDYFCPEKWPSKQELIDGTEAVSWADVIELTELNSLDEVDIGLRTSIGGLQKEVANEKFANELNILDEQRNIISPTEGGISPLIENILFDRVRCLGHNWLWIGDEHCTERKLHWIDDLKKSDEVPYGGCVFTPDKSLLVTTHWDSHFSFVCTSNSIAEQIIGQSDFEGFYCDAATQVYWSIKNEG